MIALVAGRISDSQPLRKRVELCDSLSPRHSRLQAADSRDPVIIPRLPFGEIGNQRFGVAERHPELRIENGVKPVKSDRGDAHHGEEPTGKADRFAENCRIRGKTTLPKIMAKHNDLEVFFGRKKSAAVRHGKLRNVEEIGGRRLTPDPLRLANSADRGRQKLIISSHARERFHLVADVTIKGPRKVVATPVSVLLRVQAHQRRRVADRRAAKYKLADHGKNGRVGSDAEADRHDDGQSQTWCSPNSATNIS